MDKGPDLLLVEVDGDPVTPEHDPLLRDVSSLFDVLRGERGGFGWKRVVLGEGGVLEFALDPIARLQPAKICSQNLNATTPAPPFGIAEEVRRSRRPQTVGKCHTSSAACSMSWPDPPQRKSIIVVLIPNESHWRCRTAESQPNNSDSALALGSTQADLRRQVQYLKAESEVL